MRTGAKRLQCFLRLLKMTRKSLGRNVMTPTTSQSKGVDVMMLRNRPILYERRDSAMSHLGEPSRMKRWKMT